MTSGSYNKKTYKPGEIVFKEGDVGDCAYIVQSGTVKVIKAGSTGKEVALAKIGKGGIVGEMAIVEDIPRFATIKAEDNVELMMIPRETFDKRIQSLDKFTNILITTLIDRLKTQSQKTVELAIRHAELLNQTRPKTAKKVVRQEAKNELKFDDVAAILVDRSQLTRAGMKSGFFQHGLRGVRDVSSIDAMLPEITGNFFDLLILDSGESTERACHIIRKIRHGHLGDNCFIVIVALANEGDKKNINALINAGADEVVTKPYSVNTMLDQLKFLITNRRPFVVTNDYVGPDRFVSSSNPSTNIPRFEVPNTLQLKATGQINKSDMKKQVDSAEATINKQRVQRDIVQLAWLLERVDEANRGKKSPSSYFKRMANVLNELSERGRRTEYASSIGKCSGMEGLVRELAELEAPSSQDLAKLRNMADDLAYSILA